MPRLTDILPDLSPGGYTAIVDVSKEFYHFPTREEDRPYLGLVHPVTGKHLWYAGLPMGSASSPGTAGQGVAAILRVLLRHEMFEGTVRINSVTNHLTGQPYRADWPEGRVTIGADGYPVPAIWVHVDDFMVHHATYQGCCWALDALMDLLVRIGLLAHRKKVKPPAHVQQFCGFEYDTISVPTIRIPAVKRDHAHALLQYLQRGRGRERLSRLTLAVIVGKLQSLVPATAGNVGATFLRGLYSVLHADDGSGLLPSTVGYYYRPALMTEAGWADASWWLQHLAGGEGALIRAPDPAVLVTTAGDGSGTGSGNTVQFDSSDVLTPTAMELWMGVWWSRGQGTTSNTKEIYTLLAVLRRERHMTRFCARYVFYFPDNNLAYHAVQRGSSKVHHLHRIVREIKLLVADMDAILEVVHIPGLAIIRQGSDPLSRGLWLAPDPRRLSPREEIGRLFLPISISPPLLDWACVRRAAAGPSPAPRCWRHITWTDSWHASDLQNQATLWAPHPRIAAQAMAAMVLAWVESPFLTEALFLLPRICTREWKRAHKSFWEISFLRPGQVWGSIVPWQESQLPVVLVHLPPHIRLLPPPPSDVVSPPLPPNTAWQRTQATYVRGLS